MNKKLNLLGVCALSLLMVSASQAVIVENAFGNGIGVSVSFDYGEAFYLLSANAAADIGSQSIGALGAVHRGNKSLDASYRDSFSGIETRIEFDNPQLAAIRELLTKVPTAKIKIIADPQNNIRPKIILPTLEQLKEQLKKEGATAPAQAESKESAELAVVKAELAKAKKTLSDIKALVSGQ